MSMDDKTTSDEPLRFVLYDKTPGCDLALTCMAKDEVVKENWVSQICSILDMQKDFVNGMKNNCNVM